MYNVHIVHYRAKKAKKQYGMITIKEGKIYLWQDKKRRKN